MKSVDKFNLTRLIKSLGFIEYPNRPSQALPHIDIDRIFRHQLGYSVQITYKDGDKKDIQYILLQQRVMTAEEKINEFNSSIQDVLKAHFGDDFYNKWKFNLFPISFGGYIKQKYPLTSITSSMREFRRVGWKFPKKFKPVKEK